MYISLFYFSDVRLRFSCDCLFSEIEVEPGRRGGGGGWVGVDKQRVSLRTPFADQISWRKVSTISQTEQLCLNLSDHVLYTYSTL